MERTSTSLRGCRYRVPWWRAWKRWTSLTLVVSMSNWINAGSETSISDELRFLLEPHDITAVRNRSAVLDCQVESSLHADVFWIKDGATIQHDSRRYKLQNDSLFITSIEHWFSHRPDEGSFQCAAHVQTIGTIISRKAKLRVAYIRGFIREPKSESVHLGDVVLFSCHVDASPSADISWYKDGQLLSQLPGHHFIHSNMALEIHGVKPSDFGHYQCRAWNQDGELFSQIAHLSLNEAKVLWMNLPEFLAVPPAVTDAFEGGTVVLSCTARGCHQNGATVHLEWQKDGFPLTVMPSGEKNSHWSFEGQGSLQISNVTEADAGLYVCRAVLGNTSEDVYTTVRVLMAPRFLKRPTSISALANSNVELDCDVYAHPPATIEWLKNGDVVIASDYFQIINGHNLRILGVMESDEGMYQCTASNKAGMIQASAHLVVSQTANSLANRGVPFGPERLLLATLGASSVTVAWHPSPLSRGLNIASGYTVSWKEEGSRRTRSLNTTFIEAEIEQLKPSTKYTIHVEAYNAKGPSQETAELHVETLHAPELKLQATAISSTSIQLSWEGVSSRRVPITHYKLYCNRIEYPGTSQMDVNVLENQYTVTGLLKFCKYQFRVIAYSQDGPQMSSEAIVCQTLSDVPTSPPQNITADAFSSTGITIGWDPPPDAAQNGVIEGYIIEYKTRKDKEAHTVTVEGGRRSYDFTDLEKGTEYNFRLQALTVNGSGPASYWMARETLKHDLDEERVPGRPSSLRVRPLADAIMVSWTPPVEQHIRIRGYILGYGIGFPDIFRQILDARRRHHTVKGLKPSSEYVISLKAFNYAGEGIPIYETTVTREITTPEPQLPLMPPIGVKTTVLSSTSIILTWSDTSLGRNHKVTDNRYYTIRYNPKFQHKYRFVNTTELSLLIEDLRPDTEYEFSVKVLKGNRESTWSLSAFNSTKESAPSTSPRDLTIVPVGGSTAVVLNWQPPRLPNGQITGYLLYYSTDSTKPDSEWVVEGVLGDRLSTTFRELTSDTTYYFRIQARNAEGSGPMSPTTMFRTLIKADGSGGFVSETSDSWRKEPNDVMGDRGGKTESLNLWIIIGCVAGSLLIILLFTIIAVLCFCCSRRHSSRKQNSSLASPKSKGLNKGLKPPDLWIHGNVELAEMEHFDPDDASEVESATIGKRRRRSANDKGGREDDRYRSTTLRPVPLVIHVDTPPSYREAGGSDTLSYHSRVSTGNTTFPSRSQYAATPRVNIADVTQPNLAKEQNSGSSSFRMLPSNHIMLNQACLPLLAPEGEQMINNHDNSSPNCLSTEELSEEMANIEGLMRDLNDITCQHFSY